MHFKVYPSAVTFNAASPMWLGENRDDKGTFNYFFTPPAPVTNSSSSPSNKNYNSSPSGDPSDARSNIMMSGFWFIAVV